MAARHFIRFISCDCRRVFSAAASRVTHDAHTQGGQAPLLDLPLFEWNSLCLLGGATAVCAIIGYRKDQETINRKVDAAIGTMLFENACQEQQLTKQLYELSHYLDCIDAKERERINVLHRDVERAQDLVDSTLADVALARALLPLLGEKAKARALLGEKEGRKSSWWPFPWPSK